MSVGYPTDEGLYSFDEQPVALITVKLGDRTCYSAALHLATTETQRLRITVPKSVAYLFVALFYQCSMLLDR